MHDLRWQVESSKRLIDNRWISLRADSCRMPDGTAVDPYYVLDYPDWVNILAITDNNEAVMTRQYRHGVGEVVLELPSGCVEPGESPIETVKRELLEETGYTVAKPVMTGKMAANPCSLSNYNYCFASLGAKKVAEPNLDETEEIETVLVPMEELIELVDRDKLQAYHTAALFAGLKSLGALDIKPSRAWNTNEK